MLKQLLSKLGQMLKGGMACKDCGKSIKSKIRYIKLGHDFIDKDRDIRVCLDCFRQTGKIYHPDQY